jgi:hypothetical protein
VKICRYIRQSDGTYKKEGEVSSRNVYLRSLLHGVWKEALAPVSRTGMTAILEGDIQYLKADIYELTEVESTMSDDVKEKLAKLNKLKKNTEEG